MAVVTVVSRVVLVSGLLVLPGSQEINTAGCAGYNDRAEQTESLFNSYDLRKDGIIVQDTTKHDGGKQRLEVDGIEIQLDFVDNKTLSFKLRAPTATELEELQVHWLSPRRPDLKSGNGSAIRRQPAAIIASSSAMG